MRVVPCPVSAEELRRLVLVERKMDKEIAALFPGGTVSRVQSWRKRYEIESLQRWERYDVPAIEGRLRSLLVGSMLGDGRIVFRTTGAHYEETHSEAQRAYTMWKAKIWEPWPLTINETTTEGPYLQHRLCTVSHGSLVYWRDLFYPSREKGWKRFRNEVVDLVDPFALAIWYLDDGCAAWWPDITFGADDESRKVALLIFEKFGLKPRWQHIRRTTGNFHFEREETAHRFLDLIRPHVPECMSYKLQGFGFQGHNYQLRNNLSVERLQELAARGIPIQRIASELGEAPTTVSNYLLKHGIAHPRKRGRPAKG